MTRNSDAEDSLRDYFGQHLNRQEEKRTGDGETVHERNGWKEVESGEIVEKKMKGGKVSHFDRIKVELLKYGGSSITKASLV